VPIDVTSIKSLLGDRILIKPLARPERRGLLMLPMSSLKEKGKQSDIWWGTVEALGRDARYPDAYGIKVGDIVGCEFIGRQCETLQGKDGEEHCWVAEEFIAAIDSGRVKMFHNAEKYRGIYPGILPVGQYILVRPDPEEETRNGIHIPMNSREQQKIGKTLAVSIGSIMGSELSPLHVEDNLQILYGRYSGSWVKLDEDLLLMKQEDVIAVLERSLFEKKEVAHA
jgi:chaperonin GroES